LIRAFGPVFGPVFVFIFCFQILLRLSDAFHVDGLPVRIKTASESVHRSFNRCALLEAEGYRREGQRRSKGGMGKAGWAHWYTGSPVIHATTAQQLIYHGGEGRGFSAY
jgi:hypothetical protein